MAGSLLLLRLKLEWVLCFGRKNEGFKLRTYMNKRPDTAMVIKTSAKCVKVLIGMKIRIKTPNKNRKSNPTFSNKSKELFCSPILAHSLLISLNFGIYGSLSLDHLGKKNTKASGALSTPQGRSHRF